MPQKINKEKVVDYLRRLPDADFLSVLQAVFQEKQPYPQEARWHRSRYFLGVAGSQREEQQDEPERWGEWNLRAAAYPDRGVYAEDTGPDSGFCQHGACESCGTKLSSNVTRGICPICGAGVHLS